MQLAISLCSLALYDTVIFCDDSGEQSAGFCCPWLQHVGSLHDTDTPSAGSMAFEEGGERIDDLKLILSRASEITTKFDSDGILVRPSLCPLRWPSMEDVQQHCENWHQHQTLQWVSQCGSHGEMCWH